MMIVIKDKDRKLWSVPIFWLLANMWSIKNFGNYLVPVPQFQNEGRNRGEAREETRRWCNGYIIYCLGKLKE